MMEYIVRRFAFMLLLLVLVSIFSFILIQLPPGDYVTSYISQMQAQSGITVDEQTIENIKAEYGIDQPVYMQYIRYICSI